VPYQKVGTDLWKGLFEDGWLGSEEPVALKRALALSRDVRRGAGSGWATSEDAKPGPYSPKLARYVGFLGELRGGSEQRTTIYSWELPRLLYGKVGKPLEQRLYYRPLSGPSYRGRRSAPGRSR